jgi:hypothetical protein
MKEKKRDDRVLLNEECPADYTPGAMSNWDKMEINLDLSFLILKTT